MVPNQSHRVRAPIKRQLVRLKTRLRNWRRNLSKQTRRRGSCYSWYQSRINLHLKRLQTVWTTQRFKRNKSQWILVSNKTSNYCQTCWIAPNKWNLIQIQKYWTTTLTVKLYIRAVPSQRSPPNQITTMVLYQSLSNKLKDNHHRSKIQCLEYNSIIKIQLIPPSWLPRTWVPYTMRTNP